MIFKVQLSQSTLLVILSRLCWKSSEGPLNDLHTPRPTQNHDFFSLSLCKQAPDWFDLIKIFDSIIRQPLKIKMRPWIASALLVVGLNLSQPPTPITKMFFLHPISSFSSLRSPSFLGLITTTVLSSPYGRTLVMCYLGFISEFKVVKKSIFHCFVCL